MTMNTELDKTKKYSLVVGVSGARFKQDGEYFGALGNKLKLDEGGLSASPVEVQEAPDKEELKLVEYDSETVSDLEGFDEYADALRVADVKYAKASIKDFALSVVGLEKINTNKGLGKLIDETRAEYKAVLEADIV